MAAMEVALAPSTVCVVAEDFKAESETELSVAKGNEVTILERAEPENAGWILVKEGSRRGFVPIDFLSVLRLPTTAQGGDVGGSVRFGDNLKDGNGIPVSNFASTVPGSTAAKDSERNSFPSVSLNGAQSLNSWEGQTAGRSNFAWSGPSVSDSLPWVSSSGNDFDKEQRAISREKWAYREELLGSVSMPYASFRTWSYRDFFDDIQGPFNAEEMRQRLDGGYINEKSTIVIDTGVSSHNIPHEEELRDIFQSPDAAFLQPPLLSRVSGRIWFFAGTDGKEYGPFNNEQMLSWYKDGYFAGGTLVRLGNNRTGLTPLMEVYKDPDNAFLAPPRLPGADVSTFRGEPTLVLTRSNPKRKNYEAAKSSGSGSAGTDKVTFEFDVAPESNLRGSYQAPPPPPPQNGVKESKPTKEGPIVIGGKFPKYSGIPQPNRSHYSSNLYVFLTRPLNPDAGVINCCIRRDIDGSHINFNKYLLILEDSNTPLLTAFRHHSGLRNYYDIKLNNTGRLADTTKGLTIARLELNFVGSKFLLHSNVPNHQGNPKDLMCVEYEKNRMSSKGPRKMKCAIPLISNDIGEFAEWGHQSGENMKGSELIQQMKHGNSKDLIVLKNKPPRWSESKKSYMLDFGGRVKRSSVKNFQLVIPNLDPKMRHIVVQHGRTGVNRFSMDCQHPVSLIQGFAIALSSLHSKKGVD